MKRRITVYHTHIEVYPYEEGEVRDLEEMYSVWDPIFYHWKRIAYYVFNDTLYLPRGANLPLLQKIFKSDPMIIKDHDPVKSFKIKPTIKPRDRIQTEAVNFLCSEDKFVKGSSYSQLALNLEPGDGKTIATILAIATKYKCRAIIIVHQTKLKLQWKKEFFKASNITDEEIVDLVGSESMLSILDGNLSGYIYLVNHQTIHSFGSSYGWDKVKEFFNKICVGVKVYDEAHKYFSNITMIDFFSNTEKTIYLTATFTRNQSKEKYMFKNAFSNCYRFGEETSNYEEKRKHIIYYYVRFNSEPNFMIVKKMYNKYSVSSYKYIDYALMVDDNRTLMKLILLWLENVNKLRGKILIISPKIESTEAIASCVQKEYPEKIVSVINSSKNTEENENAVNADIISSTMKSLGTGIDIKKLRVIINTEPFTSESNMIQLIGRLREFSSTDDTIFIDLIDSGIKDIEVMGDKRKKVAKKRVKEIRIVNF